jgi:hypothetical protein
MAERFAGEGMKVVLADVDTGLLASAERDMKAYRDESPRRSDGRLKGR